MADKLNAAKTYVDISDDWHVHYKRAKTFHSSLSGYVGVDKENRIDVIAFHKCWIVRACIFELLKPLNINIKGNPGKVKW